MNDEDILSDYSGNYAKLSKMIKSWNLSKVNSINGFDGLAKKILNKLYEGDTEVRIRGIIESELCVTYGLFRTEFDSDKLSKEIMGWWNGNK